MIGPGLGEVMIAEIDGAPVAAVVVLRFGRTATYKFGASNDVARRAGASHALLWAAVEEASRGGCEVFDFGRSDLENVGLRRYKAGFGAVERPLLHTWLGAVPPTGSGRAQSALGAVIKHSPAWVCRAAGSALYRFAA
jgi:CelD/BcsL family acetyltransferase involved in cellulose biosynthesis